VLEVSGKSALTLVAQDSILKGTSTVFGKPIPGIRWMSFAEKPSNYDMILRLRKAKKAALKPCPYIRESTQLRSYQSVGVLHFILLSRMVLGDSVGLGKTLCEIAAYCYLLSKDPTLKLLVITPKSALLQWAEEFERFTTGITTHVMTNEYGQIIGKKEYGPIKELEAKKIPYKVIKGFDARAAQYETVTAHVLITNYYALQEDYYFLIANRMPNFIFVLDEIQAIKNEKTKTHFGAAEIAAKAKRVYGLSATLIKNRLEEAYNIYNVVVPGLFGSKMKFLQEYTIRKKMVIFRGGRKRRFNKIIGYKNLKKFKEIIDPYFLIRRTREVADELPILISKKLLLEMSGKQSQLYKQALSGDLYRKLIQKKYFEFQQYAQKQTTLSERDAAILEQLQIKYDESLTKVGMEKNKIAALTYCQLVSNGPAWLGETGESSKELEFVRLFEQELYKEKVIVFSRFKSGIPRLEKILDNLEQKHVKITGDDTSDERNVAKLTFQDNTNDTNIIFITQAGSAAINLQAANIILFYDTPWSYGDLYQAIGRAQRIGSTHSRILLMHMVNEKTIDEHVLKILESKKDLITQVMGDIAEGAIDFKKDVMLKEDESNIDALYSSVFGS